MKAALPNNKVNKLINSISIVPRSSEQIQAEIKEKLGFIPPFFSPANQVPQVLENLWQQTLSAYLNNPLPALFKEKLSAYLSRFCAIPYCMVCHSCSLYALGMQAQEVLALLESPLPNEIEIDQHLNILAAQSGELSNLSEVASGLENSLLACAIFIAMKQEQTEYCRSQLRRLLGIENYQYLLTFIAYVKTCHTWMEANPEVSYKADKRVQDYFKPLIKAAPDLVEFFTHYWKRVQQERQTWAQQQAEMIERKRNEEALRKVAVENLRLARAIASTSEGVLITDPNQPSNPIIYCNPAFSRITGYESEEIIGRNCRFLQGKDTDSQVIAQINQALKECRELKTTLLNYRKDGQPFWNELTISPVLSEEGELLYFVGIQTDITERKRREEAFEKQAETLQKQAQLLDLAYDAILVRDMNNRITFWNQGAEHTYGVSKEEALGKISHSLLKTQFPKPLEEIEAELLRQNHWEGELTHTKPDGKQIVVASRWALQRDKDGNAIAVLEINSNITEKKLLESQFFRAQRMESIGTLASGITHDLNNVLTPILSSAQLLLLPINIPSQKRQALLQTIENSAKRGANLLKQVLSFARGAEGKQTVLQVGHLIVEIRQIVEETFPKSINIRRDIAKDLWLVSGDPTQLHQVLMNLCVNARDAMPEGGTLSLRADNFWVDEHYAKMNLDAKVGPYIVVTVSDTGMGITPEILDRIFEPFFTTKELGKGTGLGLSTVMGIVKGHGGFIEVISSLGEGTQFKIYLPAVKEEETLETQEDELIGGQGELILVVDDEREILKINQTSLETYNYRVLTASDGIEAIALYAQHKDQIAVVLLDLMMPVMDGATTVRTLVKINPQVKIIAASGLMSLKGMPEAVSAEIKTFLPKPYTAKDLVKSISSVISH